MSNFAALTCKSQKCKAVIIQIANVIERIEISDWPMKLVQKMDQLSQRKEPEMNEVFAHKRLLLTEQSSTLLINKIHRDTFPYKNNKYFFGVPCDFTAHHHLLY